MRLDKYLSECDIGTRNEVKKLIKSGYVTVNNDIVLSPQTHIDEKCDEISIDGMTLDYKKYRYFLLYKPKGCVTAVTDNVYPTVMEYLYMENIKGCSPVGRLDLDTEGVLLITNDGKLSHKLLSPNHHVEKTYFAILDTTCPEYAINAFEKGIDIGDEKLTLPAKLEILENKKEARLTIHEGRYHQVKRMFECVGCNVTYLRRESMGALTLKGLEPGEYREISLEEISDNTVISK